MALPININELLTGKTVEWERIEFREGWNPENTLRTICAFANDFNNWGGGYIVLGVAENNGVPVFPPTGIQLNQIDKIQQELNQICRRILPNYFPIVEPVDYQHKKILIFWCPGGSNRPYKVPETLGNNSLYFYFIRRFSCSVKPTVDEERELISMANKIPFDDQVNHSHPLSDLDLSEIKTFLNDVESDLEKEIPNLQLSEIARRMNIAEGADENLLPKNVGLLFFAKEPQTIFPSAKIEIVTFADEAGSNYTEKIFTGTLHRQLKNALEYLKDGIVKEKIVKNESRAESDRFFNYPYEALEETLCNAVFHRGYDNDSTIEVRIYPTRIDIISFPGPLPPLDKEKLKNSQFDVRKYRNRRIGEFLKELHLTEGRATGVPTIIKSLEKNNSPKPVFETDDDRTYFKTTIKIHPKFLTLEQAGEQVSVQVSVQANFFLINNLDEILNSLDTLNIKESDYAKEQVKKQVEAKVSQEKIQKLLKILTVCKTPQTRKKVLDLLNLSNHTVNYRNNILKLVKAQLMEYTLPEKIKSPNQKYVTTAKGKALIKIFSNYESN